MDIQQVHAVPATTYSTDSNQPSGSQREVSKASLPGSQSVQPGKDTVSISQEVARLKEVEEKVKEHEAAHMAAGGSLAGSASYHYKTGPDGKSYIVAGDVQIDMSQGRTPQETIARMEQVKRAALAPSDPSPQDRAVAAEATATELSAQRETQKQTTTAPQSGTPPTGSPSETSSAQPANTAAEGAEGVQTSSGSDGKTTGNESAKGAASYRDAAADKVFAAISKLSVFG